MNKEKAWEGRETAGKTQDLLAARWWLISRPHPPHKQNGHTSWFCSWVQIVIECLLMYRAPLFCFLIGNSSGLDSNAHRVECQPGDLEHSMCVLQYFSTEAFLEAAPPPTAISSFSSAFVFVCCFSTNWLYILLFYCSKKIPNRKQIQEGSLHCDSELGVQSMKAGKAWKRGYLRSSPWVRYRHRWLRF